jgi:hypothetical protein
MIPASNTARFNYLIHQPTQRDVRVLLTEPVDPRDPIAAPRKGLSTIYGRRRGPVPMPNGTSGWLSKPVGGRPWPTCSSPFQRTARLR